MGLVGGVVVVLSCDVVVGVKTAPKSLSDDCVSIGVVYDVIVIAVVSVIESVRVSVRVSVAVSVTYSVV